MSDIHQLIEMHGRDQARALVPPRRRQLIDIAADILANDHQGLGITYSGFALTALPHNKLADDQSWERQASRIRLLIEPGSLPSIDGSYRRYGVPYGSRARLIMIYLQTEAVKNNSRHVELGRSMRQWIGRMGLSIGGKTYIDLKDQALRIAACHLTFSWSTMNGHGVGFAKASIVEAGAFAFSMLSDLKQGSLWEDSVTLSEQFFTELKTHSVPLADAAIRKLANNSVALDVYVWLAYRLHALADSTLITWPSLYHQFGFGYRRLRDFRRKFIEVLDLALAVYPDARIDFHDEGILLHPSQPPIPHR